MRKKKREPDPYRWHSPLLWIGILLLIAAFIWDLNKRINGVG